LNLVDFIHFFNSIIEKIKTEKGPTYYSYTKLNIRGLSIEEDGREVLLHNFGDDCDYINKKIRVDSFVGKRNSMATYNDLEFYHYFISSDDWKFKLTLCSYYFGIPNLEEEKTENIFGFVKNERHDIQYVKSNTRELEFIGDFNQFMIDITLLTLYV